MGVPLIIAGIILIAAALQNQVAYLGTNLETDVSGFFKWALAICAIGAIGIAKPLRPVSDALLTLVIVVIGLGNGQSFLTNLQSLTATAPPAAPSTVTTAAPATSTGDTAITASGTTTTSSGAGSVAGAVASSDLGGMASPEDALSSLLGGL